MADWGLVGALDRRGAKAFAGLKDRSGPVTVALSELPDALVERPTPALIASVGDLLAAHPAAGKPERDGAFVPIGPTAAPDLLGLQAEGFDVLATASGLMLAGAEINPTVIVDVAFGQDRPSVTAREALLGGPSLNRVVRRPLVPPTPDIPPIPGVDWGFIRRIEESAGTVELLNALHEVGTAVAASNIADYNAWVGRATTTAKGIESVEPSVVCTRDPGAAALDRPGGAVADRVAGIDVGRGLAARPARAEVITLHGRFPDPQPAFTTVVVATQDGCSEAIVESWSGDTIVFALPADAAPGCVGFRTTDGPPPPVDMSGAMQAAGRVSQILGDPALSGSQGFAASVAWDKASRTPPMASLPCPPCLPSAGHHPPANRLFVGKPRVNGFTGNGAWLSVSVEDQSNLTVAWDVDGVDRVEMHPSGPTGVGAVPHGLPDLPSPLGASGSVTSPLQMSGIYDWDGVYTLTATNACGTTTATLAVHLHEKEPLFGVAETHLHLMGHLAHGGSGIGIWGRPHPDDPMTTGDAALLECLPPCNASTAHGPSGYLPSSEFPGHASGGAWPDAAGFTFDGWPQYLTLAHQQAYIDWMRRAYDGGLRLAVCQAGNSELLATRGVEIKNVVAPGSQWFPPDDMPAVDRQLDAIKAMVGFIDAQSGGPGMGWMQIATTATEARRIVQSDRLAIVLGVEVDFLGGWKTPAQLEAEAAVTGSPVDTIVDAMIGTLRDKGVTHVFPVHGVNNAFAGTGMFVKNYDAANRLACGSSFTVEPAPADQHIAYRLDTDEGNGGSVAALVSYYGVAPLLEAAALVGPALLGAALAGVGGAADLGGSAVVVATLSAATMAAFPIPPDAVHWSDPTLYVDANHPTVPNDNGHINAQGATQHLPGLLRALMRRGMIIDIDHMGHKTTEFVFDSAEAQHYPLVSGHTGFRELKHGSQAPVGHRWTKPASEAPDAVDDEFRTRDPSRLSNEVDKTADHLRRLSALGGFVSPILAQRNVLDQEGAVTNDCAGTARSFAQALHYAAALMRGRSVGLGSDLNGFGTLPGPRFGPQAAHAIAEASDLRSLEILAAQQGRSTAIRRDQALAQKDGVQYADGIRDYRAYRFPDHDRSKGAPFDDEERDAWEALAIARSGTNPNAAEQPIVTRSVGTRAFIRDLAWGIKAADRASLHDPGNDVQVAGFLLAHPNAPTLGNEAAETLRLVTKLRSVFGHWHEMEGGGSPQSRPRPMWGRATPVYVGNRLTRSVAGRRDFDINLDGMAHIGLLPDFLQDLQNVGASDVDVLYRSAEDYIRMWERCERASAAIV